MLIIKNYKKKKNDSYCIAIGNFDGIHEGHSFILDKLKKSKKNINAKLAIISFYPHPVKVLYPEKWKKNILKFRTKYNLLKKKGLDALIIINFNKNFSELSAEDFIEKILINCFNANSIVVGDDFRFGKQRKGDGELLKRYSKSGFFDLVVLEKKKLGNQVLSSSSIRNYLSSGEIVKCNSLLGYNWEVTGKVVKGKAKGRELGFPTANLNYSYQISPANGIYACWVQIENEYDWKKAAISSGVRPHYKGLEKVLEVHILDFSGNLYQKRIRVAFVQKVRNEEVFENESKLIEQMKQDCIVVRDILENNKIKNNNESK